MRGCPENVGIADRIPSNCVKYYPCSVANSRCVKPVRSVSSRGRVWTNLGSLAQEGLIDKPCDNSDEPCVERLRCRLNHEVVDNNGQVIFDIEEVAMYACASCHYFSQLCALNRRSLSADERVDCLQLACSC